MLPLCPTIYHRRLWITRQKRGLSRKKLASLLGHTTTSQVYHWEKAGLNPSLANALLLGHLLQMPVEFLFEELRHEVVRHSLASCSPSRDDAHIRDVAVTAPCDT